MGVHLALEVNASWVKSHGTKMKKNCAALKRLYL